MARVRAKVKQAATEQAFGQFMAQAGLFSLDATARAADAWWGALTKEQRCLVYSRSAKLPDTDPLARPRDDFDDEVYAWETWAGLDREGRVDFARQIRKAYAKVEEE